MSANGPVEAPLAVLRILARYFDLPFRKDVLKRIIEDQLNRSDNESEKQPWADSTSSNSRSGRLRATVKNQRKPSRRAAIPAIVLTESGPVVAWNADPTGNVLVGDPVSQITIRVSEVKAEMRKPESKYSLFNAVKTHQRKGLDCHGFYLH